MDIRTTKDLDYRQRSQLLALWNQEFPDRLAYADLDGLDHYLVGLKKARHLLLMDQENLMGWYCDFYRDGQRWFVMILSSTIQKKGWGSRLLAKAKASAQELHGWTIDHDKDRKQNGEVYCSPLPFYVRNGFKVVPQLRFETPRLSAVKILWKKQS